ncbi:MFS transporter [Stakelama tenebrarum]|uniref:MFS transporter n=1 Tax=Stakelama tenebrarum TaxID=2711215 RepID=A0A6G6Y8A2_9SPHN|nr:MFS transporter [Sphingosinithalassobacter tenebrarum]QIG80803.1 MFS transporter [Sphingosinithalassobacter tenebrarum]
MTDGKSIATQEWKRNWTLVLAASMGFSFFSIMLAATGVFMQPLARDFGWSRTLLSSGPSIALLMTAVLSPFFGALIDKFGGRTVVLPGLVVTMLSVASFGLASGSATQWIILWVIFGFVAVSIKSTAWTAGVLSAFSTSKGLALGLTLAGTAVAQAVVPPLANGLIETVGWRWAFAGMSFGWGGLTLLLCIFFFHDARKRAPVPATPAVESSDGDEVATEEAAAEPPLAGLTPREALRDSALWRVGISNFVVMVLTMGLTIHLFPILTEAGVSRDSAAWLTSLAGIAAIAGKLVTGALLDRFRPNWIGGITLGVTAIVFLLLMEGISSWTLVIFAMLVNGYAAGTKTQITGFLTASYGGMRHFGAIYGVMAGLMALASGVGPMLAGVIYDAFGGYGPFLLAGAIGCGLSGLLMISLPSYPKFEQQETAA